MWSKFHDGFYSDAKVIAAGDEAIGYFARAVTYASKERTSGYLDGAVLGPVLGGQAKMTRLTKRLIAVGMLHRTGDRCSCMKGLRWPDRPGFWIHNYLKYNPSRTESDLSRSKKAELRNPTIKAAVRERDHDLCRYCGQPVNWNDHVSSRGGQLDHVDPNIADGTANLVVSCKGCNSRKRGRTPAEAGMRLLPEPAVRARNGPSESGDPPSNGPNHTQHDTPGRRGSRRGSVAGPDVAPSRVETQPGTRNTVADSPGRDGTGTGSGLERDGSAPAAPQRGADPDPLRRAAHMDHERDPAFAAYSQPNAPPPGGHP